MSRIEFDNTSVNATFLDPQSEYRPRTLAIEHRRDPLTGGYSRITDYIPPLEKQELDAAVVDAVIPIFAPPLVEEITPKYPDTVDGSGRLTRGRSVLFPNLNPYDEYSPVVAIGDQPLVRPGELSPDDVGDALCLMRDFFGKLPEDRQLGLVGWNYLPQSSSSIPHPHLQAVSTQRIPRRLATEYAAESAHRERHNSSFWDDLVSTEQDGPRWLDSRDGWARIVAFAPPHAIPETNLISNGIADLQAATDNDLLALAGQVVSLATAHHEVGYSSFNLALHPTGPVAGSRLRARYVPRAYIVPKISSSDHTWLHVGSEEGLCLVNPERFAEQLRAHLS